MFTEVLRIKPKLDTGGAAKMENDLHDRFKKVSKRFGSGLLKVMKGSILGLSLGLLNRLLNPIEALEEKIRNLLGQSGDIKDMADKFNTSPGQMKRLQDVSASLGVKPDQLNDMMTKYAEAIKTARNELADPTAQKSESTKAVEKFAGDKDIAESFFRFIQSLRAETNATGRKEFFGTDNKFSRDITGTESRQNFERSVFGETLPKRFVEADVGARLTKMGGPDAETNTKAINKMVGLQDTAQMLAAQNQAKDFVAAANTMGVSMIQKMEAAAAREDSNVTKQLQSYDNLAKAVAGIDELKQGLVEVSNVAARGVGMLGDLLTTLKASPLVRGFFGGK